MGRHSRGVLKSSASKPPWRTPDHPPYSQMVEVALRGLSEEGGSTESTISAFIQSNFSDLPWGHDRLLPYYLSKLVVSGEVYSPSHDRYQLPVHRPQFSRGRRRTNPSSYPTFFPIRSSPARSRERSRLLSSRGRSSKDSSEGMTLVYWEQESAPRRGRGRGRPPLRGFGRTPLRRGASIGEAATQTLVRRIRRPRGSTLIKDGSRVSNLLNNRCGESAAFYNPENLALTHPQSSPGKTSPPQPPENFVSLPSSAPELPEFSEHHQGQPFHNGDMHKFSSEIDVENTVHPETWALDDLEHPKRGDVREGHPSVAAQPLERVEGQSSPAREMPLLTFEQMNVSSFLTPELSEHGEGIATQGEVPSSLVLEPAKLGEETSTGEGLPSFYPEMPEIDDHDSEKSGDGFEELSPGKNSALVVLEEGALDPLPLTNGDEIKTLTVSSTLEKVRKKRKMRRSLRLWFEG